jgi:hypothetical protein
MGKSELFLSFILIFGGLILISDISLLKITGNVVVDKPAIGFSSFGFALLILGIVILLIEQEGKLEKNLAQQVRESGRVIEDSKELIRIAKKSKYDLRKPVREGTPVYDSEGKYITVIPMHGVSWRISKNILRELAEGESSFRKRNY